MAPWMTVAMLLAAREQEGGAKGPAETLALIDAHPGGAMPGLYRMTVAAGDHDAHTVYLNSSADYRAPDDVTFRLSRHAARQLEKRLGAPADVALVGKTVTVHGVATTRTVFNTSHGQPTTFNRLQHTVQVDDADQITIY